VADYWVYYHTPIHQPGQVEKVQGVHIEKRKVLLAVQPIQELLDTICEAIQTVQHMDGVFQGHRKGL
jgi:hypothetical protein